MSRAIIYVRTHNPSPSQEPELNTPGHRPGRGPVDHQAEATGPGRRASVTSMEKEREERERKEEVVEE